MTKISKNVSEKLMNLLYTTTSRDANTKIPIVQRLLYEDTRDDVEKPRSLLDDLQENQWRQKPMSQALVDINKESKLKSNILKFNCQNSFINEHDFYNLYPIPRERKYLLPIELRKGIQFQVVKSRNPFNLLHNGSYYLLFPNYLHACVYKLETQMRSINGFRMKLDFVESNAGELKYMTSPYFDPLINNSFHHTTNPYKYSDPGRTPIKDIFKFSKSKLQNIEKLEELNELEKPEDLLKFPNFDLLSDLIDLNFRKKCVLVRNIPFGVSKFALPKLLWNYDLAPYSDVSQCFTNILSDPVRQINIHLIRFQDFANAKRFVRNFHGKKWESVQSREEKMLYEPLLCEILN